MSADFDARVRARVRELLDQVRAKVGPVKIATYRTEPLVVIEYTETKSVSVTGDDLIKLLEGILETPENHDCDATGPLPRYAGGEDTKP